MRGPQGPAGPVGPAGPQGPAGGVLGFADYYAIMPADNAAPIAAGADIAFPQTAASGGTSVTRLSGTTFNLAAPGSYLVQFTVPITEAGQLVLTENGTEVPYTLVGRTDPGSQITGVAVINTPAANTTLSLRNPAAATAPLTVTANSGGTSPASAHLVITQIA